MKDQLEKNVVETDDEKCNRLKSQIEKRGYILKAKMIPNFIRANKDKFKDFKQIKFNVCTESQLKKAMDNFLDLYNKSMLVFWEYESRYVFGISPNVIITNTIDSIVMIAVGDENIETLKMLADKIEYIEKLNERDSIVIERIMSKETTVKHLENVPKGYMVNIESFEICEVVLFESFGGEYEELICDLGIEIIYYILDVFGKNSLNLNNVSSDKIYPKMKQANKRLKENNTKLGEILGLDIVDKNDYCKIYNLLCYYDPSYKDRISKLFEDLKEDLVSNIEVIEELYEYFFLAKEDQFKVLDIYKKDIDAIQKALESGYINDLVIDENPLTRQFDIEE